MLAEALPNSSVAFASYNMIQKSVNFALTAKMDESFVASYVAYYSSINPWMRYIADAPPNEVLLTERDMPASSFRDSEFHRDWLSRHGDIDAFAGLKVSVDEQTEICIGWHYAAGMASVYDETASAILERLRLPAVQAVQGAAIVRELVEEELRLGPMIEQIDGAALMLERDRRIREANARAVVAFTGGRVLIGSGDVLSIRDPVAQRWLEETIARLVDNDPVAQTTIAIGSSDAVFKLTATLAPDFGDKHLRLLLQPRSRVLLVVKPLSRGAVGVDAEALRVAYGLSSSEIRLCEVLLNGRSLAQAAQLLGVSDGTVRQRVKMIFLKTRTHRQGELIAVLARFSTGIWSGNGNAG